MLAEGALNIRINTQCSQTPYAAAALFHNSYKKLCGLFLDNPS